MRGVFLNSAGGFFLSAFHLWDLQQKCRSTSIWKRRPLCVPCELGDELIFLNFELCFSAGSSGRRVRRLSGPEPRQRAPGRLTIFLNSVFLNNITLFRKVACVSPEIHFNHHSFLCGKCQQLSNKSSYTYVDCGSAESHTIVQTTVNVVGSFF